MRATSASACEQNHFSPVSRQVPASLRATVSTRPMSEPPAFSVMNCVPFHCTAGSADSMRGSR